MSRPFGPFAGHRRRGPPPFVFQILRAPMTLNNIIALSITLYMRRNQAMIHDEKAFTILAALFAMSIGHNVMSVMRFHRIRREVFGGKEGMCAARRRWKQARKQGGEVELPLVDENERMQKFKEMGKRMPSLFIATGDLGLAVAFLGTFVWTTMIVNSWGKVELGVAYSTIGALVAFVFNFLVGMGGVKFWARMHKKQKEEKLEAANDFGLDVKEGLLEN